MTADVGALSVVLNRNGANAGPLAGASFVVKENIDVAGERTTNGHPLWAATHEPARANAPIVDRLLAAGARLVGKTHMDEMAYSLMGANPHFGAPINPAAPDRHPGGSSSGSAILPGSKPSRASSRLRCLNVSVTSSARERRRKRGRA